MLVCIVIRQGMRLVESGYHNQYIEKRKTNIDNNNIYALNFDIVFKIARVVC